MNRKKDWGMMNKDRTIEDYLSDIKNTEPLSREEEKELAKRVKEGDLEAERRLIEANLKFVVSVAKEFHVTDKELLKELIAEGNTGLITAVRRFDETRGYKLISYAVWWIKQAMLAYMPKHGRLIKPPTTLYRDMYKIDKAIETLNLVYERIDPASYIPEISNMTGISEEGIVKLLGQESKKPTSLDGELQTEEYPRGLHEMIADKSHPSPEAEIIGKMSQEMLEKILSELPVREAKVLRFYYGFKDGIHYTLEEIGSSLGLTREGVRQIKERGLKKLRHSYRLEVLRELKEEY
ncbi:MAG: sigma-70 family RNA polymerase sigma factor [Nanoarchaeota archaeon]|nr:sigma-70 family RNA polymerase sigma factor [Nanoarchaeota archaeon]